MRVCVCSYVCGDHAVCKYMNDILNIWRFNCIFVTEILEFNWCEVYWESDNWCDMCWYGWVATVSIYRMLCWFYSVLHLIISTTSCIPKQVLYEHFYWYTGATSNGSWCMGIKGEMSGTVCVTFTWYMYIYELFIAFVCFVISSLL